ncbi:MAG: nucleotidyl transferase AbiEii/AbiGii toxin family protein, partial [Dehalococcoidia bacterium]|nr:nucleotidyl transferase AbiEii/AbiGii toxin family protein [Dehalococcoidia bacterium]
FFESQQGPEPFYLSGGTALGGYYLAHRYSDDLDFFTRDRANLEPAAHREQLERAVSRTGLSIERSVRHGDHLQYALSGDTGPHALVKVEFLVDPPPHFVSPERQDTAYVDGVLAIGVNKLTALGRREPKDYVDLYEIIRSGRQTLDDLIQLATQKDPGITLLVLADDFDSVVELSGVADLQRRYMVAALDWHELVRFYQREAGRLRELVPPRERRPWE